MATIPEALAAARGHQQAGRTAQAENIYREILRVDPNQADALYALGLLLNQLGRSAEAIDYLVRLTALHPENADFQCNLGVVYWTAGRREDATTSFRKALEIRPDFAQAHSHLGVTLTAQARLDEAVTHYQRALELRPNFVDALSNLAATLTDLGRHDEAIEHYRAAVAADSENPVRCNQLANAMRELGQVTESISWYERALSLRPAYPAALNNFGNALNHLGRLREAVDCYRKAVELQPGLIQARFNLANALSQLGEDEPAAECFRQVIQQQPNYSAASIALADKLTVLERFDDAIACTERAIALDPDNALLHGSLGNVWMSRGKPDKAYAHYDRAISLDPESASHHYNLGNAIMKRGELRLAEARYRVALDLSPDFVDAQMNLGNVLLGQGKLDEALDMFRRAHQLAPENTDVHCNLLMNEQYRPEATEAGLLIAHRAWDNQHGAPLRDLWRPFTNDRNPDRRLRIGFVSGDLGNHPVASFLVRCLEANEPNEQEFICYSTRFRNDAMSARIASTAALWRDVRKLSQESLTDLIRSDAIDILIDLAGHTDKNRLLVFARKPAPIQATWIGYPGTTGMAAMDYLICDRFCVPAGSEPHYQERVLRLPDGLACYEPPDEAPAVGPLPALSSGHVTLGSFNNTSKITSQVVSVWAEILRRLPGTRMVIKYGGFGDVGTRERYIGLFASHGVEASRFELRGRTKTRLETLEQYNDLDLALDPFPYGGATTTCEALWMGVPVVTFPGATFASRVSQSHVSNAGSSETIARDRTHYVELAVQLAQDIDRLATLRAGLRDQMASSPLCDGPRLAKNFISAMRQIWVDWCRGASN